MPSAVRYKLAAVPSAVQPTLAPCWAPVADKSTRTEDTIPPADDPDAAAASLPAAVLLVRAAAAAAAALRASARAAEPGGVGSAMKKRWTRPARREASGGWAGDGAGGAEVRLEAGGEGGWRVGELCGPAWDALKGEPGRETTRDGNAEASAEALSEAAAEEGHEVAAEAVAELAADSAIDAAREMRYDAAAAAASS